MKLFNDKISPNDTQLEFELLIACVSIDSFVMILSEKQDTIMVVGAWNF